MSNIFFLYKLQKIDFSGYFSDDLIRTIEFLFPNNNASLPIMHKYLLWIFTGDPLFVFLLSLLWHETPEVFTAPYQVPFITLGFV